jgi:hypothetical protein
MRSCFNARTAAAPGCSDRAATSVTREEVTLRVRLVCPGPVVVEQLLDVALALGDRAQLLHGLTLRTG